MLTMLGDFAVAEGAYQKAFGLLDQLGLFTEIRADKQTTLEVSTWSGGRLGETHLFVGDTDVGDTVPQMWCTPGVEKRPGRIQLMIVSGLQPAQLLETWPTSGACMARRTGSSSRPRARSVTPR